MRTLTVRLTPELQCDSQACTQMINALQTITPRIAVLDPGIFAFPVGGAARYLGGESAVVNRVATVVEHSATLIEDNIPLQETDRQRLIYQMGIADGVFASQLAAQRGFVIPPGKTPEFLKPWPIGILGNTELTELLPRLGIHTLGDFAALAPSDIVARFGQEGIKAHRLARGIDVLPLKLPYPAQDIAVEIELDPPTDRIDTATFHVKALADELHGLLVDRNIICQKIDLEVTTEHGQLFSRKWRHGGDLSSTAVAERMRWQLENWLTDCGPTARISSLRLIPEEIQPRNGEQGGLWGPASPPEAERLSRVAHVVGRLQGILGSHGVLMATVQGGRTPHERIAWTPWGEIHSPQRSVSLPWPGKIPAPSPATVYPAPLPAVVANHDGKLVRVSGRHEISSCPGWLSVGSLQLPAVAWAGPWPADERWWDVANSRRHICLQLATADGKAWLVSLKNGQWLVEASYD